MKKSPLICLLAALLATPAAYAEGFYVAGALGRASIDLEKSETDAALTGAGVTGLSSSVDENDTYYGLSLGYALNANFAIEAGYVDFGDARYRASFTGGNANARVEAHGWALSVLGILPLGDQFSVFGRLGGIQSKVEIDVDATGPGGSASGRASDREWSALYGVGAGYAITPQIGVRAEYTRYDKLGGDNTGEGDVDTWSLGMTYRF